MGLHVAFGDGADVIVTDLLQGIGVVLDGRVPSVPNVPHQYALPAVPTEALAPVLNIAVTAIVVTTHRDVICVRKLPTVGQSFALLGQIRNATTVTVNMVHLMVPPTRSRTTRHNASSNVHGGLTATPATRGLARTHSVHVPMGFMEPTAEQWTQVRHLCCQSIVQP